MTAPRRIQARFRISARRLQGRFPGAGPFIGHFLGATLVALLACVVLSTDASGQQDGADWVRLSGPVAVMIGDDSSRPGTEMFRVVEAIRLSDGRIVVADAADRVRLFDRAGRAVRQAGGAGDGPGEFRAIAWMQRLAGDSLLIMDRVSRRLTFLDPDLNVVRIRNIGVPMVQYVGRFDDGTYAATISRLLPRRPSDPVVRQELRLGRYDEAGDLINHIATLPGAENLRFPSAGNITLMPTFARRPRIVVDGDRVLVSTGEEFRVDVFTMDGGILAAHSASTAPPEIIPRSAIERAVGGRVSPSDLDAWPDDLRYPSVSDLQVDDGRKVWLAEFSVDESDPARYVVFGGNGEVLRRVEMPPGFRATDVGEDFVVGVWRDELDVEVIQLYE